MMLGSFDLRLRCRITRVSSPDGYARMARRAPRYRMRTPILTHMIALRTLRSIFVDAAETQIQDHARPTTVSWIRPF
jgi:hypothetical protein